MTTGAGVTFRRRSAMSGARHRVDVVTPLVHSRPLEVAFLGDPGAWLPRPARRNGFDTWLVTVHAGPVDRTVDCFVGGPWTVETITWRHLQWRPYPHEDGVPGWLLPVLVGDLGLLREPPTATLVLSARYKPPVGTLGAAVNTVAMHRVAHASARRFLDEVASRLSPNTDRE